MPPKNSLKQYVSQSYYHIYNRGNNKNLVFFRNSDYKIFRNIFRFLFREYKKEIFLDCYCLLPNHYHLLIYQESERAIEKLMRSGITRYVMFINKRYQRVGRLFQGPYKAALVPPNKIEAVRQYILDNPINAGHSRWKHVDTGREL